MTTETKLWRYVVPSAKCEGWGIFVIGSDGFFSAVSDYGNYAYTWSSFGSGDFRDFVVNCLAPDAHYTAKKLCYEKTQVVDVEATARNIKQYILEERRQYGLTKERARDEWDNACDLERGNIGLEGWHNETKFEDCGEFVCHATCSDLNAFCTRLMPRLAKIITESMEKP